MEDKYAVKIPKELYNIIKENIKNTHFKSVDEYIIHYLKKDLKISDSLEFSKAEEEDIKKRLKSLGYLE